MSNLKFKLGDQVIAVPLVVTLPDDCDGSGTIINIDMHDNSLRYCVEFSGPTKYRLWCAACDVKLKEPSAMPAWQAGKTYRTRSGEEALIYCTDAPGDRPIHGRVGTTICSWRADGKNHPYGSDSVYDLLPPEPPRIRERRYCNVYASGMSTFRSKATARAEADGALRVAVPCELIEIEEDPT